MVSNLRIPVAHKLTSFDQKKSDAGYKLAILSIAIALVAAFSVPNAFASHSSDPIACEGDGLYDGKNNPFSQELYGMCGDPYYQGFIEGCMSVEGNTRDVCESATDAE
jgi:hypothetical protein